MEYTKDAYVLLAKKTLETYVRDKIIDVPEELPEDLLNNCAGAFVSIHKSGELRGCIGTIFPTCNCLAEEIIQNAISAGTRDPRFPPVGKDELNNLEYKVDVLGEPEAISGLSELDAKRYGVIVSSGSRRGLLLPDLEGVDTPEEQVAIAMRKAGIYTVQGMKLERFEVIRHK